MTAEQPQRRERHPMPDDVRDALDGESLWDAFLDRPAYQQNDYVGWISRAKRSETREKRLRQMLDELAAGGVYMKMKHAPSSNRRSAGRASASASAGRS